MKIDRPYRTDIISGPPLNDILTALAEAYTGNELATIAFEAAIIKTIHGSESIVCEGSFTTEVIGLEYVGASRQLISIMMHNVVDPKHMVKSQMTFYYDTDKQSGFAFYPDTSVDL